MKGNECNEQSATENDLSLIGWLDVVLILLI
jgi:hypothetical protein